MLTTFSFLQLFTAYLLYEEVMLVRLYAIGITLVDVLQNWFSWFHFLFFEGGLLLIDCIIFLSPFLDVARMYMSTVSFLAQLDPGILCL